MKQFAQLKMETEVNRVLLLETSALVSKIGARLHNPSVTLRTDGFQRLFSVSGV